MSGSDHDLNQLFFDMASQSTPPESAEDQLRRRQRAIGGMRSVQRQSKDARGRAGRRLRYSVLSLVAAAALCGSALASAGGWLHFGGLAPLRRSPPARVVPTRAAVKPPGAPVAQPAPAPASAERTTTTESVTPPAPRTAPKTSADLEQVNRLFAEAKRARREHRDADELLLLQRLLAEHPGSVLAPEASVERFRALARLGRSAEAARYASAYLTRYPNGYAAEEAQRLLNSATP